MIAAASSGLLIWAADFFVLRATKKLVPVALNSAQMTCGGIVTRIDDHSVRESLKKLLETEHYDVHPARNAVDALEHFRSNQTDLVVLDLNLGTYDGWKVFHTMAAQNPFVPTVIITAEFDQRERAVAAGVEALIEKPIDVPVFLKIISDLLAETSEQRLERVCGDDEYCRYVARHYEPLLSLLNERHSAPLRLSSALNAVLSTLPVVGKQLTTVET